MALYHLSVGHVSRSSGRSSVQSAAYITGEKLHESRRDLNVNYQNREPVAYFGMRKDKQNWFLMEAIKGDLTMAQISSQYGVYATQIARWKKEVIEAMVAGFNTKAKPADPSQKDLLDQFYQQISQLTVERDWLKKNLQPLDLAVHSTLDPYAGKLACTVFTEVDHSDEVPPDCFGLLHVQALQKTADPDKNQSELGA